MQQKIGRKILLAALLLVLPLAVGKAANAAAPTPENDYKQGKVYKISPKTKPLKASKYKKSSLYNAKTRNYFSPPDNGRTPCSSSLWMGAGAEIP